MDVEAFATLADGPLRRLRRGAQDPGRGTSHRRRGARHRRRLKVRGFPRVEPSFRQARAGPQTHTALVVGAGLLGLYAAHRLTKEGFNVAILEQRMLIGGIWQGG